MVEKKPIRWRRAFWIALAAVLGIPLAALITLKILFADHAIPQDRLSPPPGLLKLTPAASSKTPSGLLASPDTEWQNLQKQFIDHARTQNPGAENLRLLEKWREYLNSSLRSELSNLFSGPNAPEYTPDQPLNPEQLRWLREHREFLADMIQMADAGGFPELTCEDAATMTDENLSKLHNPYSFLFGSISLALVAECRRRMDEGDPAGAAEIILALGKFARSADEPDLLDQMIAFNTLNRPASDALKQLVRGPLDVELAKKLRGELTSTPQNDFRRQLEISYRANRYFVVKSLNGPLADLFYREIQSSNTGIRDRGTYLVRLYDHPMQTLSQSVNPAFDATVLKATADTSMVNFDQYYAEQMEKFRPEKIYEPEKELVDESKYGLLVQKYVFFVPGFHEAALLDQARLSVGLAGLDMAIDQKTSRTDPFSGAPLKIIQQPNETLIYSIGPDRADDRGTVEYNWSKGYNSPGDIAVHLARAPEG
ncbi:MAG: hypothetical protein ABFD69_15630 [Candidatus Sumerlaeia bacterium]